MDVTKPKVLLIGSGILQAFGGESWNAFLDSLNKFGGTTRKSEEIDCPSPLKAIIMTNDHVDKALKEKFSDSTCTDIVSLELAKILQEILSIGFDHIFTTNYTYELESASIYPEKLTEYRLKKMQRSTTERCESKYLLHTYMSVPFGEKENKVWHIHGEARKTDSVVLGHYYYGNLLCKIKEEVTALDAERWKGSSNKNESWIDAFLFGDVYCLGFGFGLCEFDLWWLINRKARENENTGKVYFYNPLSSDPFDTKLELLKLLKTTNAEPLVENITLDFCSADLNGDYKPFYMSALTDIKEKAQKSLLYTV